MGGPCGGSGKGLILVEVEPIPNSRLTGISRGFLVLALVLGAAGVGRVRSVLTFGPRLSSSVVLSRRAPAFAIDSVNLAASPTPEPASMTLLGVGLISLGVFARRLKQGKDPLLASRTRVREGRFVLRRVDRGNPTPSTALNMRPDRDDLRELAG
jgi:hypothetical protein